PQKFKDLVGAVPQSVQRGIEELEELAALRRHDGGELRGTACRSLSAASQREGVLVQGRDLVDLILIAAVHHARVVPDDVIAHGERAAVDARSKGRYLERDRVRRRVDGAARAPR